VALNNAMRFARGAFYALIAADDVSYPERFEKQLEYLDRTKCDLLFSSATIIDDFGRTQPDIVFPGFFGRSFSSTSELFNLLFYDGNFLCAPTALVRREVMDKVGKYRRGSIQLQDFDMWVRIAKRFEVRLMPERLVYYRVSRGSQLSSPPQDNRLRVETLFVYRKFLDDVSPHLLYLRSDAAGYQGDLLKYCADAESGFRVSPEFEIERILIGSVCSSRPNHPPR
jgi:hypothetical protein